MQFVIKFEFIISHLFKKRWLIIGNLVFG